MDSTIMVGSMTKMWRDFNLPSLQENLDKVALEITTKQDESVKSRKLLVESFKKYKENTPDDVKKLCNQIIKSFQSEIDKLTKRSKHSETAFLNTYKKLLEVSDPVPALDVGDKLQRTIQRQHDAETENQKMRETIEQNNKELSEHKRNEREMKNLQEKISKMEENLEKEGNKRVEKKEKELKAKFAEQEAQLQETQLLVANKLAEVEQKAAELQQKYSAAQSELFKVRAETEEKLSSKHAELDMLNNDLERLNSKVACDAQEINELRNELDHARQSKQQLDTQNLDSESSNSTTKQTIDQLKNLNSTLERDLREKERELGQQIADMTHLQENMRLSKEHAALEKGRMEKVVEEKMKNVSELEFKLNRCRDYEEIRRELNVLKSVEFPDYKPKTLDPDPELSPSATPIPMAKPDEKHKSLEVLLLEKNRYLQSENTQLRLQQSDLAERYENSQTAQTDQRIQIENQEKLIRQLESDLLSVNHSHRDIMKNIKRSIGDNTQSLVGSEATNYTTFTTTAQKYNSPFIPVQNGSMSTELISDAVKSITGEIQDGALVKNVKSQQDNSILTIISSQRERFRQRVQELEEHSHVQTQTIQMLNSDMDQLRTDNVKLYEKIKFLQSYNGQLNTSINLTNNVRISNNIGLDPYEDIASRKYAGQYEEQLDPFAKFSQRERARKYMNLAPHDKITLSLGRYILGSKTARVITFFYTIGLHLLLYIIFYKLANIEECSKYLGRRCAEAGFKLPGDNGDSLDPFEDLVGKSNDHPDMLR